MSYCNRDYDRSVGVCCHNALGLVRIGLGIWLRVRPLMHHDNKPLGPAFMPQTKSVLMTPTHLVYNWFRVNSKDTFNLLYNMDFRRQYICWSLRCSWISADRRDISNLDLTHRFNGLGKDCKTRRGTFKLWYLVHVSLEVWRYFWSWYDKCRSLDRKKIIALMQVSFWYAKI